MADRYILLVEDSPDDELLTLRALRKNNIANEKEESDIVRGYSRGAKSYVRNPVDLEEFVEVTKRLGLYWLVVNQPPPSSGERAR